MIPVSSGIADAGCDLNGSLRLAAAATCVSGVRR